MRSYEGVIHKEEVREVFEADSYIEAIQKSREKIMKKDYIPVLIIESLEEPTYAFIRNSLNSFQKLVKGTIEITTCPDLKDIDIICNDDGKNRKLDLNRALTMDNHLYDVVAGPMILTATDNEGNTIGLSDEQLSAAHQFFAMPEVFVLDDLKAKINVIKCTYEMARIMKLNFISNVSVK